MTENEIVKQAIRCIVGACDETCKGYDAKESVCHGYSEVASGLETVLKDYEQYRAIGTVEELEVLNRIAEETAEYVKEDKKILETYQRIGTIEEFKALKNKHIGSDNMVISSSDLMTILNSDSDKELEAYRAFGTVEEIPVLFKENHKTGYEIGYAKGIDDLVNGLLNWKSQDEEYKSFSDVCNEIAKQLKGGAV